MPIVFSSGSITAPTKIIQVQSTRYTGVHSASGNWSTVSGLNCSITPKSSSHKILVMLHVGGGFYGANTMTYDLLRNGSSFYIGDADGSRDRVSHRTDGRKSGDNNHMFGIFIQAVDSPSTTSSVTYGVRITGEGRNQQMYINREGNSNDQSDPAQARTASTMTLLEFVP